VPGTDSHRGLPVEGCIYRITVYETIHRVCQQWTDHSGQGEKEPHSI
jgi:hypothetical protein